MSIQRVVLAATLTIFAAAASHSEAQTPNSLATQAVSPSYRHVVTAPVYRPIHSVPPVVVYRGGVTGDFRNHYQARIDQIQYGITYYRNNAFVPMHRHPDRYRYLTRTWEARNWRSRPIRERNAAAALANPGGAPVGWPQVAEVAQVVTP